MHKKTLERWQHEHNYGLTNSHGEKRTTQVLVLTALTMIVEIVAGSMFNSMALLADGWHMGTHVAAFMIAIFAYRYSRKHANNLTFSFGTGKVSVLGGFASAVVLAAVALVMVFESIHRFFEPQEIYFNQAIVVAIIGLLINVISAFILKDHHHHGDHSHHHHDHNLKAAYMHVLADALTSVLAIIALFSGKYFGWNWLDPIMGIVGAVVILRWSYLLIKETSPILLDNNIEEEQKLAIIAKIENDADNRISDFHAWKVGANHYAVIISIVTHFPKQREHYVELIKTFDQLAHITIEVIPCPNDAAPNTKSV